LSWLRQAARHSEALEEVLLADDYELSKAQIDGLWAYVRVRHKGQKGATRRAHRPESSGAVR
jgi:hypothetical protein